jgi:ribonuclease J
MPSLTIHRGARQIGGCVTEVATDKARVFIDIGDNLPGQGKPLPAIDGLTAGDASGGALFLTHYHGDHTGQLDAVLPQIPVWMGKTAKAIQMNYIERKQQGKPSAFERVNTFEPLERITVGDISVTQPPICRAPRWIVKLGTGFYPLRYGGHTRFE